MGYIGVDIGGSKIAVGFTEGPKILAKEILANQYFGQPDVMAKEIIKCAERLQACCGQKAEGIGVGCPGWVIDGVIYEAVNLGIDRFDLQQALRTKSGLPARVDNDARTALLCEKEYGALKDSINGAMVTFGTGIGGALLLNGEIYRGSFGYAGEIGHMTIGSKAYVCDCGKKGCYELFGSTRALTDLAKSKGIKIENGRDFFDLANHQVPEVMACLEEYLDAAACGIIELGMLLDLDTIAVGGAISAQQELFVSPLAEKVKNYCPRCRIRPSAFENDAGIIGAAVLGRC